MTSKRNAPGGGHSGAGVVTAKQTENSINPTARTLHRCDTCQIPTMDAGLCGTCTGWLEAYRGVSAAASAFRRMRGEV